MNMQHITIVFIGGGNMAQALMTGLLKSQDTTAAQLTVFDPSSAAQSHAAELGVTAYATLDAAPNHVLNQADMVILAVKPQLMESVCQQLAPRLTHHPLIVSIAAGIPLHALQTWLNYPHATRIVRCMPNTPALVGEGMTGVYVSPNATAHDRQRAHAVLSSMGRVIDVAQESDLHAITAVSGSGPAYVFYWLQAWIDSAQQLGLSAETARTLVMQTAHGALALAQSQPTTTLDQLRTNVTSKGGTTEAAIQTMTEHHVAQSIQNAVAAAAQRSRMLAGE
jgi:pyrroline-5-carboxylate reductase